MRLMLLAAPALLAGCVATAPITQPPVKMSFQSSDRAGKVTGVETVTVHTRLATSDHTAEVAAVPCRLSGPGYSATFQTPAILELPLFGNTAPQLSLSCAYDGETRSRALTATNVSAQERREARKEAIEELSEEGASGTSVLLSIGFGRRGPRGFDEFDYPNTTFTFRR
ncbi:MAG: hypothetical protein MK180_16880 [Rhodobacteraceae bacterium]|nr:hypothetical protein [Paracoccaceae bacterium]